MVLIDTFSLLHEPMTDWWNKEHRQYLEEKRRAPQSRFDSIGQKGGVNRVNGDELLEKIDALFNVGFGIEWSPSQLKVYKAVIDSILPIIYGKAWNNVGPRVMQKRKIDLFYNETIVSMGRRNGKTWVVSGIVATLFLLIPGFVISIFSVAKRQSSYFTQAVIDKIEMAFKLGTHVKRSDYRELNRNQDVMHANNWSQTGLKFLNYIHVVLITGWVGAAIVSNFSEGVMHMFAMLLEPFLLKLESDATGYGLAVINNCLTADTKHRPRLIKFVLFMIFLCCGINLAHLIVSIVEAVQCTSQFCESTYWFLIVFIAWLGVLVILEAIEFYFFIVYLRHMTILESELKRRKKINV